MAKNTHGPGIDDPLIVRKSGNDYFYYKNHQGSVTELRDANGAGYKTYVHDAFGNIEETGPTFNRGFTYTGRELHNRSGLYYYRARFYNPELGRFITQDPIGYLGGVNLYAYVGNNPVNFRDPLGLFNLGPVRYRRYYTPFTPEVAVRRSVQPALQPAINTAAEGGATGLRGLSVFSEGMAGLSGWAQTIPPTPAVRWPVTLFGASQDFWDYASEWLDEQADQIDPYMKRQCPPEGR